jgi:hypothetical protein
MPLEYVTDSLGKRTGVIIPIATWNNIINKYEDVKELISPPNKPSDFAGKLRVQDGNKLKKFLKESETDDFI